MHAMDNITFYSAALPCAVHRTRAGEQTEGMALPPAASCWGSPSRPGRSYTHTTCRNLNTHVSINILQWPLSLPT